MIGIDALWEEGWQGKPYDTLRVMPVGKGAKTLISREKFASTGYWVLTDDSSVLYEGRTQQRCAAQIVKVEALGMRGLMQLDRPVNRDYGLSARLVRIPIATDVTITPDMGRPERGGVGFADGVQREGFEADEYPTDIIRLWVCSGVRMENLRLWMGPTKDYARGIDLQVCDDVQIQHVSALTGKHLLALSGCTRVHLEDFNLGRFTDHAITWKGWCSEGRMESVNGPVSIAIGNPSYDGGDVVAMSHCEIEAVAVNQAARVVASECEAAYWVTQAGGHAVLKGCRLEMPERFRHEYDPLMSHGHTIIEDCDLIQHKTGSGRRCYRGNVTMLGTNELVSASGWITDGVPGGIVRQR